jgi:hypothetical protein
MFLPCALIQELCGHFKARTPPYRFQRRTGNAQPRVRNGTEVEIRQIFFKVEARCVSISTGHARRQTQLKNTLSRFFNRLTPTSVTLQKIRAA